MKTDIARRIAAVVAVATLAWAGQGRGQDLSIDIQVPEPSAPRPVGRIGNPSYGERIGNPSYGQDLDIDIQVPEPVGKAAEGNDLGKRRHSQRGENPRGARRNPRPSLDESSATLDLNFDSEPPASPNRVSGRPALAPPKNKAIRSWEAAADDDSWPGPAWANPAGIALREEPKIETARTPPPYGGQPAAGDAPSAGKKSKNRGKGVEIASGHSGRLGRRLQAARREADEEDSPPLVARRHRAASSDRRQPALSPLE